MWKDATPRTLEQMHRRGTRYEVIGKHTTGPRIVVGFTSRTSRHGLLKLIQSRGEDIIERCAVSDDSELRFIKDAAGRWWAHLHGTGWRIGFTGRTERDVHNEGR